MYVLGIDSTVPSSVLESIGAGAASRGSVAVVNRADARQEQTDWTYHGTVGPDAGWELASNSESLEDVLDILAPRCEYVLLEGVESDRFPSITWADGRCTGELLSEPISPDDDGVEHILDRLENREPWITLETLVEQTKAANEAEQSGAIATFTGRVRAKETSDDTPTEYLEFERYGDIADQRMAKIRAELCERDGVFDVRMHHRTGVIPAGVDIVFVVVLAGHREEAFTTVEDGINRLKAEVPIFKKEVTVDEEFWVHTRP